MEFYTSISEHYDFIFPYSPAQVNFVQKILPQVGSSILDIGCGTGNLSQGLHEAGYKVKAIDYDTKMVELAKLKNPSINFEQMDMLEIDKNNSAESLDAIVTFGNTLVHLIKDSNIESFLNKAHRTLKKDGIIAIQILNYQNIIHNKISTLPLIENDLIRFERQYNFREDKLIDFVTRLSIKASGETIENCIQLNPITADRLEELLEKSGFKEVKMYGNFKMDELQSNSIPLVLYAKKK